MRPDAKVGVVLLQLGGPDSLEAVEPFLYNLFCDPDIINFPGAFLARKPLARFIASRRAGKVAGRYREIGGKSPIMLSLVADARHVIGVDLAHDRFMGAVVDLRGRIMQAEEQPVPPRDGDAAVAAVYALLDKLVRADRKSTRLNSSHVALSRMPSSA